MSKHCEHMTTHIQLHTRTDILRKAHADLDIYKYMACTYTHIQRHTHTHTRKHKQGEALPSLFYLIFVAFKVTVNYSCLGCSDGI